MDDFAHDVGWYNSIPVRLRAYKVTVQSNGLNKPDGLSVPVLSF